MSDKTKTSGLGEKITSAELEYILDVNKKAIEIHIEVEKQNEQILNVLEKIQKGQDRLNGYLFKLLVIFGTIGISTIISVIQMFIHH
jgi:hypothetical protein